MRKALIQSVRFRSLLCVLLMPMCLLTQVILDGNMAHGYVIEIQAYDTLYAHSGIENPNRSTWIDVPGIYGASITWGPDYFDNDGYAYSSASANLRTGELRAFASATNGQSAFAHAMFADSFYVRWDDPNRIDPIPFSVTVTLHSSFAGGGGGYPMGDFAYLIGQYSGFYNFGCFVCPFSVTNTYNFISRPFIDLTSFQVGIDIGAATTGLNQYATFDAGHTAGLGLVLPDGASFVSGSGAFLNPSVTPVPEPGTGILLGLGFSAFIILQWNHRRQQNSCG